ncbi:hypothetical protein FLA_4216 [Filimonas lacunae]|nr:hypothetical protein FLA_4216 [Filimonas lacunae]
MSIGKFFTTVRLCSEQDIVNVQTVVSKNKTIKMGLQLNII